MRGDGIPRLGGRLPVFGHMIAMYRDMRGWMIEAERRHGPLFWFDAGFDLEAIMC